MQFNPPAIGPQTQVTLIVLILSIVGVGAIYLATTTIEPLNVGVESIDDSMVGRMVLVGGEVVGVRKTKSGSVFWSIGTSERNLTVPLLEAKFKSIDVEVGESVVIKGLVSEYQGELEIMPKEIAKAKVMQGGNDDS
jgi:DNA/RNA endonuclease YhcR with UshA esterase domain